MKKNDKIYIAGHTGFLGSAIKKYLIKYGFKNLVYKTHKQLDLSNFNKVSKFFKIHKPDVVINAAGESGNLYQCMSKPAYLYNINSSIQNNLFEISRQNKVKKLVYIASSCIYPEHAKNPIKENSFLNGKLEAATEGLAAAKISGIIACKAYNNQYYNNKCKFIPVVPNTLFGPNDNFNLNEAHVFSALVKKFFDAVKKNKKEIKIFGSGKAKREFSFTYNIADAIIFLLKNSEKLENCHYNLGPGTEVSIKNLAKLISKVSNYKGKIVWDKDKHEGRLKKKLECSKIKNLGWRPLFDFDEALNYTYNWYRNNR